MTKKIILSERFINDLKTHLQSISSNVHYANLNNYNLGLSDSIDINMMKLDQVIKVIDTILKNTTPYEYK
jgi:hypothetical protein